MDPNSNSLGVFLTNSNDTVVAYASSPLNIAEKNWRSIEKKLPVWSVKHLRPHLYRQKCVLYTDHRLLLYLFGMANPCSRLTKFQLTLEQYDFTVKYIKGKDNCTADCLLKIGIRSAELEDVKKINEEAIHIVARAQTKLIITTTDVT